MAGFPSRRYDDRAARDIVRGLDSIERICAAGVAKEGIPEPICPANADVMDKDAAKAGTISLAENSPNEIALTGSGTR